MNDGFARSRSIDRADGSGGRHFRPTVPSARRRLHRTAVEVAAGPSAAPREPPSHKTRRAIAMTSATHTSQGTVSLEDARRVTAAAEDRAREIGQPQNIAVVDAGGNLVSHVRMDGAWIGSVDIAINKAFTARAFDLPTADLAAESQPGGQFYGIQESNKGRVVIFAGGVPLQRDDEVVGAVGVSGGDGDQDTTVAEAAAAA